MATMKWFFSFTYLIFTVVLDFETPGSDTSSESPLCELPLFLSDFCKCQHRKESTRGGDNLKTYWLKSYFLF